MRQHIMITRGRYPCAHGIRYAWTAVRITPHRFARIAWGMRFAGQ